jgi:Zn-dependent peptidase ImmA (M78 family)
VINKKIHDNHLKLLFLNSTLDWCRVNMGLNPRKRKEMEVILSEKKMVKKNIVYYGKYCFNKNRMTIYINNCETIYDVISTIIHEYTHYLQSSTKYREYTKKYYYSQNPCERQAKKNETKYTKTCFNEIKNLIVPQQ